MGLSPAPFHSLKLFPRTVRSSQMQVQNVYAIRLLPASGAHPAIYVSKDTQGTTARWPRLWVKEHDVSRKLRTILRKGDYPGARIVEFRLEEVLS